MEEKEGEREIERGNVSIKNNNNVLKGRNCIQL